jgi:hypothetical protein
MVKKKLVPYGSTTCTHNELATVLASGTGHSAIAEFHNSFLLPPMMPGSILSQQSLS